MENILNGTSEAERVLYDNEDPLNGFVILPDLKWNCSELNSLYLVAIARQAGLYSLRDLRRKHVPILKEIRKKGKVRCMNFSSQF